MSNIVLKPREVSEPQHAVLTASTQRILNMAGQGGGKSFLIGLRTADFISLYPKVKGFIAANTSMQLSGSTLSEVFKVWLDFFGWSEYDKENPNGCYVINKQPPAHFKKFHKVERYNNTISFENGCLVFTGSLENFKAHDGKEFGWAFLDETKDTKEEAINTVIIGRLRQRGLYIDSEGNVLYDDMISNDKANELNYKSWAPLYISTSPAHGQIDWLLRMFKIHDKEREIRQVLTGDTDYYIYADEDVTAVLYQSFWNDRNLASDYISSRTATLTENEQLKFIRGYPFAKAGGEAFKEWDRNKLVRELPHLHNSNERHLCFDFNVVPYLTMLDMRIETKLMFYCDKTFQHFETPAPGLEPVMTTTFYAYKEYPMESPQNGTANAAIRYRDILDSEFESPSEGILSIYGDSTGNNRIPGIGGNISQFSIIYDELYKYLFGKWKYVPKVNYPNKYRISFMNRVMAGKVPGVIIVVDPQCTNLISDFDFIKEGPDGAKIKEKVKDANGNYYEKYGHFSDAFEYGVTVYCKTLLNLKIQ